ncbi:hypothetical protein PV04_03182 [Phialophora macrospora]|uniref:DUF3533 domain-containing protein n=1 Tax=Phialophora macrospora TaxID=1851006 RepID=A0A0D2FWX1_9EURO|nr:hypothetical protein PV04_03182 [Phialophora macrospora]
MSAMAQLEPLSAPFMFDNETLGSTAPSNRSYQSEQAPDGAPFLVRANSFGSSVPPSTTSSQAKPSPPLARAMLNLPGRRRSSTIPPKTSYHSLAADVGETKDEDFWAATRKPFLAKIAIVFALLQLLFLGNLSYLYGSLWGSSNRVSNLHVLWLDLDGGAIGQSVSEAYAGLQGPAFPSFEKPSPGGPQDVAGAVHAVRSGLYWAAFVVNAAASTRLDDALAGGRAARSYNASTALTYVWNEVRYPPFSDEALMSNFEILARATEQDYLHRHGLAGLQKVDHNDSAAVQVLFHPIGISDVNIAETTQPARLLYNTATMVMPVLQQFFFVLILNGLSDELGIYKHVASTSTTGILRVALASSYTLLSAAAMTGYVWAFRETWHVDARQFFLTWMVLWLLHAVHFVVVDTAAAVWPVPVMPFFILTWIVLNLSSSVSPLELNPRFYHWGYALPDNEAYALLTDIWSRGAVPVVHRAVPILGAWLVVGAGAATFGHVRRCRRARAGG